MLAIFGSDFQSILSVVFGLIATIGAGLAAIALGTIKTLRESNTDLRERDGDREKRITELETKVEQLQTANDVLSSVVRNDEEIRKMTEETKNLNKTLATHHEEAKVHWAREESLLKGAVDELNLLAGGEA